ncbi:hypothetical protein L6452_05665 [Arctium lappa]|uniref:Uncharacterized protein n=1 Tax=Arctium lappa TaxID=4217 RepID=A0ACB9EH86_ARCLA|nr:hypothetical protein L6452_05665 [Arctium lappa]
MKTKPMTKEEGHVIALSDNTDSMSNQTPYVAEKEKPKDARKGETSNPLDTLAMVAKSVTPPSSLKEKQPEEPQMTPNPHHCNHRPSPLPLMYVAERKGRKRTGLVQYP